jgi:hypothetical protein
MGLGGGSESMSGRAASGGAMSGRASSGQSTNARVEDYLARLQKGLAGLNREDAAEIVGELRSHILEKAVLQGDAGPMAMENVLAALGSPEDLAAEYMANDLLKRAAGGRSPLLLLRGLLRWASLSAAGAFVLLGCMVGYFAGACFTLCAFLKPLHPHAAGLWRLADPPDTYSLRLGFGPVPVGGTELLGWWTVPVGILVGGGLCFLTTQLALWCVRQFRKSHALRRG